MAQTNECSSCCGCGNDKPEQTTWETYSPILISLTLLIVGIALDYIEVSFFSGFLRLGWYIAAYLAVGHPIIEKAIEAVKHKDFFNEFTLMILATFGAFAIGEYPEAVAVILFYSIGEMFQTSAVNKARRNIKALLDIRPETATVLRNGKFEIVSPENVSIGETIQIKAGEKIPLDGKLLSARSSFDTSALTGESKPRTINEGEIVLAGMLNLDNVIEIKVEKEYANSSLAKILELVQNASSRKAKTEQLITRFARSYTPIVFALALSIATLPYFFVQDYLFADWLYRALVFLVISCPCALVISIPLGYFGGIGAASKNGILFKGANYLDLMTKIKTVVMDKTGTLTKCIFKVKTIHSPVFGEEELMSMIAALENYSNHPIAKAITAHNGTDTNIKISEVKEIAGHGLQCVTDGKQFIVGNCKLMHKHGIPYPESIDSEIETVVIAAYDNQYIGHITIADEEKEDAATTINELKKLGIHNIVILSGDKTSIAKELAQRLGIKHTFGDLLPEEKVAHLERLKAEGNKIAFMGDGINDAPSLALSDIGVAMGGLGSDAAIEIADVIIQTDQPSKIAQAIRIAHATRRIVIQNIIMAFAVKLAVLLLGAYGMATMWEAVFADVGVALLAILNAIRVLNTRFK